MFLMAVGVGASLPGAVPDALFRAPKAYVTGEYSRGIATGDFNRDGKPDLAVVNQNSNTVSILLNAGQGNFAQAVNYPVVSLALSVTVGDFNNDGIADLAVGGEQGVSILLGKGDGSFQTAITAAVDSVCYSVALGDFNRDGKVDLAVGVSDPNFNGGVAILLGNGNGTFQSASFVGSGATTAVVVADFNGDHKADLAYVQMNLPDVTVILGNGDGTFGAPVEYAAAAYYPLGLATADLDGDGKADIVVAGDEVSVLLGTGSGGFAAPVQYLAGTNESSVAIGDFNGDGRLDLAVAINGRGGLQSQAHDVAMLLGDGKGGFKVGKSFSAGIGASGIAAADFNQDGRLDVAVSNPGAEFEGGATVLMGNGLGGFAEPIVGKAPEAGTVVVADFNSDGFLDVAVGEETGEVAIFLGNGSGEFQPAMYFPLVVGGPPGDVRVADINGDGKPDLVFSFYDVATISVLLGNGDGTFQAPIAIEPTEGVKGLVVADFNGDGKPDIATFGSPTVVSVFLGNGDGTFQGEQDFDTVQIPAGLAVGDLNLDGKPDLIIAGREIGVMLGAGNGTFGAPIKSALLGVPPAGLVTSDFNGDGIPDVAVGSYSGDATVPLGNGNGTLRAPVIYASGAAALRLVVGDFNRDGESDIAVSDHLSNSVFLLLGMGDGTFSVEPVSFGVSAQALSIAAGDLNGDGKIDLVVGANPGLNVLLNITK